MSVCTQRFGNRTGILRQNVPKVDSVLHNAQEDLDEQEKRKPDGEAHVKLVAKTLSWRGTSLVTANQERL
ncbi:hypothetical protein HDU87_004809 [Geranomyces variabilis]|uniref:Uncharacterized protein n=1 Tax=Geranomyces variabilis TaxID=109894 RepID=A0AAD5XQB8_9FUNG|nr:hypothetical protein HDU87_004809 [Geranomyces variabilis]